MNFVDSFLEHLRVEKNYSIHTIKSYANDLAQFRQYLASRYQMSDWSGVQHDHIRSWIVFLMKDDYTPRSIARKISSLKSFFKTACKKGWIKVNPSSLVTVPKVGKRLPQYVREDKLGKRLEGEEEDMSFSTIRNRLIVEMLYQTGMRKFELINLRDLDVNFARKEFRIKGKGNKERRIPVSDGLLGRIREYLDCRQSSFEGTEDALIVTDKGKKTYPKFIYNAVHRWLASVTTQEKRSPHVLRHTFATHMINNGADLNAIKEILGHASLAATQIYTHNSIEQIRSVYRKSHPKAR